MSYSKLLILVVAGLTLAGCGGNTMPDPDPQGSTVGSGDDTYGPNTAGDDPNYDMDPIADEGIEYVIYFDFDSYEVRGVDQQTVSDHANMMGNDSRLTVRLEGHADERGSREYNIGLGERRAQAVRQMLMIQGVSASQIRTVSFGEEQPEAMGSSEADYAQNRRVEFVYDQLGPDEAFVS